MSRKREERIDQILLFLRKCDYLTREQIQRMVNLGQTRNAQIVLNGMSEYLSFFTDDRKKVYYLNSEGRERVQAKKIRKKTPLVTHFLMRNDYFIFIGKPGSWRNEIKIDIPGTKNSIITDAAYVINKFHHFVEIDYKQSMSQNVTKIKRYKEISNANPNFVLEWVTTTPYRKKRLESLCKGLNFKIYLWDDIK